MWRLRIWLWQATLRISSLEIIVHTGIHVWEGRDCFVSSLHTPFSRCLSPTRFILLHLAAVVLLSSHLCLWSRPLHGPPRSARSLQHTPICISSVHMLQTAIWLCKDGSKQKGVIMACRCTGKGGKELVWGARDETVKEELSLGGGRKRRGLCIHLGLNRVSRC